MADAQTIPPYEDFIIKGPGPLSGSTAFRCPDLLRQDTEYRVRCIVGSCAYYDPKQYHHVVYLNWGDIDTDLSGWG